MLKKEYVKTVEVKDIVFDIMTYNKRSNRFNIYNLICFYETIDIGTPFDNFYFNFLSFKVVKLKFYS